MRRLLVFSQQTLDGFFASSDGDVSWAHKNDNDAEWKAYVAANASGESVLLFGRVTYELMASYWPTPQAAANDSVVAEQMNNLPKVVFSRTLDKVPWKNTTLIKDDPAVVVRRMKQEAGPDLAILGSGSLVSQLTRASLVDEYQMVLNPLVLGKGRTLFEGIHEKLPLKLTKTRVFSNGNILLCSEPMRA